MQMWEIISENKRLADWSCSEKTCDTVYWHQENTGKQTHRLANEWAPSEHK